MQDVFAKREELARLGEQITDLAGHLNAGNYRFLVLIKAFDREDGWQGEGIRACQRDLNRHCWRSFSCPARRRERGEVALHK